MYFIKSLTTKPNLLSWFAKFDPTPTLGEESSSVSLNVKLGIECGVKFLFHEIISRFVRGGMYEGVV